MEYAIDTLSIENARIEKALREIRSTPFKAYDREEGYFPQVLTLEGHIRELQRAVQILQEWQENNP